MTYAMDGGHCRDLFDGARIVRKGPQLGAYRFEPDYLAFLGFADAVIHYVANEHPDAERVDFVVERKTLVTHHLEEFVDDLSEVLERAGRPRNAAGLIGQPMPGDKTRVPLQAADLALWHLQRCHSGQYDRTDERRYIKLFGNERPQTISMVGPEEMERCAGIVRRSALPKSAVFKKSSGGVACIRLC